MLGFLDLLAWISLAWYATMVLMAISGSLIAFRKYRQPPPPPPFPISTSPLSQMAAPSSNPTRPNSKTQNLLIPSVSILRPLCGLDYGLRENLESAFLQQWPLDRFEIILCLADPADPARKIAQDLISKYPAVRARLLIGEERVGMNPKINNLMQAYRTAEADLLWILDSNARVHPTTLARAVSVLCPPSGPTRTRRWTRIGLVHHLPMGILPNLEGKRSNKRGLGSLLESCFLNGNHARQYLCLNALGVASCLMGKSNLFYRSDLEQATRRYLARNRGDQHHIPSRPERHDSDEQASLLGSSHNSSTRNQHSSFDALELFGQFLAEDNMIGQTLWDDGIRHAMTIDVVGNVVGLLSVKDYFSRRIRWIRARKYMTIGATLVEPFTESILLGIVMTLAVERLSLTNGIEKKVMIIIHEAVYFTLDYLVYRSLLHSPLVLSALQSSSMTGTTYARQPAKAVQPTSSSTTQQGPAPSSSSSSSSSSFSAPFRPHPYTQDGSSPPQDEPLEPRAGGEEDQLIQVRLSFFEFMLGWALRECSALSIWLIAMSSNTIQWRNSHKILKVLRNARVAESN